MSIDYLPGDIDQHMYDALSTLTHVLDDIMFKLTQRLLHTGIFGAYTSIQQFGEKYGLPLLQHHSSNDDSTHGSHDRFGMVDVVRYIDNRRVRSNTSEVTVDDDNSVYNTNRLSCSEHTDPGLLSLNVLSTQAGLQFHDLSQNKWVDIPHSHIQHDDHTRFTLETTVVLWLGELAVDASSSRLKAGAHRVRYQLQLQLRPEVELELEKGLPLLRQLQLYLELEYSSDSNASSSSSSTSSSTS